ncbi:MAG: ABC transporter ATP-binding protein [Candidatus Saccharibacteria bacterium]
MENNNNSIISVKDITKIYYSGNIQTRALDCISIDVSVGEFVMITGRNGSGKSTLMHQLALLDKPTGGTIIINEQDVTHLPERKRADLRLRELGYVFQEYALIAELTALENVMLSAMMLEKASLAKKKAIDLLNKVGLKGKYKRLPSQLSGGEQQKVAIARSLINHPKIIFADEPTANLDTVASKEVLDIFKSLNELEQITIVMVTHEPEELHYATRRIQLSDGRLL